MTEMSTRPGTFSRSGSAVSLEEPANEDRGEEASFFKERRSHGSLTIAEDTESAEQSFGSDR